MLLRIKPLSRFNYFISISLPIRRAYSTKDLNYEFNKITHPNIDANKPTIGRTVAEHQSLYVQQPDMPTNPKILKASILGVPNSGKSTLVNRLMNRRISAVSNRINTTRNRITAVLTDQDTQLLILDTPGLMSLKKTKKFNLERPMIIDPHSSLWESDIILVVHDVSDEYSRERIDPEVLKCLFAHPDKESILVLNKIDKLKNKNVLFDLVSSLTGGRLNGKEFLSKEKKNTSSIKYVRNSLRDQEYEKLFERTAEKMNLNLSDKNKKLKDLFEELKACEEYLIKNQSKITIGNKSSTDDESIEDKNIDKTVPDAITSSIDLSKRITLEKLKDDYIPEKIVTSNNDGLNLNTNSLNEISLVNSIANIESQASANLPALRRIEDIDPIEFKKDLLRTTDWHLYYKKLSSLSLLIRDKHYWPYFNQIFMVSARMNDGVEDLKRYLFSRAKSGNWIFSRNMLTDQMPQEIAEMCVREKMLEILPEEIPYELGLQTTHWDVDDNDCLNIVINIIPGCQKHKFKRHLKALFKDSGRLIREIRDQSHQEMLNSFQCEIKLKLIVITNQPSS